MVEWNGGSLAWRVLDAQYWGVPQRRRRIFLVADFGGKSAGEVLFEPKSLPGNTEASKDQREEAASVAGESVGSTSESMPLATNNAQVVYNISSFHSNVMMSTNPMSGIQKVTTARTLDLNGGNPACNQGGLMIATSYRESSFGNFVKEDIAGTQKANGGSLGGGSETLVAYDNSHRSDVVRPQREGILPCLTARAGTGGNNMPVIQRENIIRRLTPVECERLQGLPDGYTDIDFNGKPAPDSRRYKALGNGMAQPCADFVIRRIIGVRGGKKGIDNMPPDVV